MSRNEPPPERQAWLELLQTFDEAHDWLEQLVEDEAQRAATEEKRHFNGR